MRSCCPSPVGRFSNRIFHLRPRCETSPSVTVASLETTTPQIGIPGLLTTPRASTERFLPLPPFRNARIERTARNRCSGGGGPTTSGFTWSPTSSEHEQSVDSTVSFFFPELVGGNVRFQMRGGPGAAL